VFVPAGTPKETAARLNAELVKTLQMPDVKSRPLESGIEALHSTPEQFAAYLQSETKRWAKVVKDSSARAELLKPRLFLAHLGIVSAHFPDHFVAVHDDTKAELAIASAAQVRRRDHAQVIAVEFAGQRILAAANSCKLLRDAFNHIAFHAGDFHLYADVCGGRSGGSRV
jgi:Tripartite tricarboxylate transporter family receptor